MEYHLPVLLNESVDALGIQNDSTYVDVTFGGGGHSREIYDRLTDGKLIAFDQDADAQKNAVDFESRDKRSFILVPANFRHLKRYLRFHKSDQVDGILADLGISSYQIDKDSRGFSTRFDGELDMRMDQKAELNAASVVNEYAEKDLIHLFSFYGDIRNARTLTQRIVFSRDDQPIKTTMQLRAVVTEVAPAKKLEKYMAQVFQAIRIEVNDEMGALKDFLSQSAECLKPGGRIVVISYHSMEDRLVKNFFNTGNFQGKPEKDFYGNLIRPLDPVVRKPVSPSETEIERNRRARSAKMRIAIKN